MPTTSLPTHHHHQEPPITFQELPLLSTPTQISKIIPKDQPLLPSTPTKSNIDLGDKRETFEGFNCLPSPEYYALGITLKKKVAAANVRLYRHSYLQQDEFIKSDQAMLANGLIQIDFSLEDKASLKGEI